MADGALDYEEPVNRISFCLLHTEFMNDVVVCEINCSAMLLCNIIAYLSAADCFTNFPADC